VFDLSDVQCRQAVRVCLCDEGRRKMRGGKRVGEDYIGGRGADWGSVQLSNH
jgi:hypothetical protein